MPRKPSKPEPKSVNSTLNAIAIGIALAALAWYARYVLMLVFAGVLLAILLQTMSGWLSRRTAVGYGWCLGTVVIALVLVLGGGLALFGTRIAQEAAQLTKSLPESVKQVQVRLQETDWGKSLLDSAPSMGDFLSNGDLLQQVGGVAAATMNAFVGLIVVGFIGLFCAADPELYRKGMLALFPRNRQSEGEELLSELGHNLRWWIVGHLVTMTIVGVLTGIGLAVLGVPQPFALAFLAFVAELVPNFGPILASIPAILLAWSESTQLAVYVVVLYTAVQMFESYLILPLIQRRAISLPPALTIVAVVLFGLIGGVLGAVVATPLTLTLFVLTKAIVVEGKLKRKRPTSKIAKTPQPA